MLSVLGKNKILVILFLIIASGFLLRIYQPLSTEHIVGVDGYYHLRIAEFYRNGDFSNFFLYPPGTHLMIAALNLATGINIEYCAILLNAIFSTITILGIFLLVKEKFSNKAGLFSAFLFAFSAQAVSYGSLVKNLNFSLAFIAFGLWINSKGKTFSLVIIIALLSLFSPLDAAMLSAIAIITSIIPKFSEGGKVDKNKIIIFSAAFIAAIVFGSLYINQSFFDLYIFKSIPSGLLEMLFYAPSITDFFIRLSPFLLALSFIGIYFSYRERKYLELLVPLVVLAVIFPFGILETDRWYVYATLFLSVFSGYGTFKLLDFSKRMKYHRLFSILLIMIIVLSVTFLANIGLGMNSWGIMTNERYSQLAWIKDNTSEGSVVLGTISESHWIFGIAERNPIATANLIEDPGFGKYYKDIEKIYMTEDSIERKTLLEKYNVSYIMFSDKTLWMFGDAYKRFNSTEFDLVYSDGIYKILEYRK